MSGTVFILTTTVGTAAEAEAIAATLVAERLAACVQMTPIRSCYRWGGAVTTADETLLTIKTASDRVAALRARIEALHPYDLPEILTAETEASPAYARWVADETRQDRD